MGRIFLALVAVAALLAGSADAGWVGSDDPWLAIAEPVFVNHLGEGGLPRTTVTALAQDRDGFLWVGTQNGLARWDGYRAKVYQPDRNDSASLPDSYVLGLHLDQAGRLWVATSAGGLARYDAANDNFVVLGASPSGLSSSAVSTVEDDGEGGLWVGTDIAVDHLGPDGRALAHFHPVEGLAPGSPDGRTRALSRDGAGRLWIGTERGLYRLDPGSPAPIRISGADAPVYSLVRDSRGRLWVGTRKKGVLLIAPGEEVAVPLRETTTAGDWVISMAEAPSGEMWMATYGGGLVIADPSATRFRRIRHDPARPSSLGNDTVWTVLTGSSGAMWIGGNGGLSQAEPEQGALLNLFGGSDKAAALSDGEVWSSLAASDGRLWVGLANNGIDILDGTGHRAAALRPDTQHPETALSDTPVLALAETGGSVWIGTYLGLYRADLSGRRVQRVRLASGKDNLVVNTLYDDGSSLWAGSFQGGLWRIDPKDGRTLSYEAGDKFTDARIQTLAPGPDGKLWIGTRNGLDLLDPRSGAVLKIPTVPKDPEGLAGGFVTSMLTDRQGRLWVATFGGGISVMTGFDGGGRPRFRTLGYAQGLPDTNVDQILADGRGRIWAGTDDGIAIIDPDDFSIRTLRAAQGAVLSLCTTSSGTTTPDGTLLFGSLGGMLAVHPEKLRPQGGDSPVAITDLMVGGHPVPAARHAGGTPLVIEPGRNSLTAEFAALDFADPAHSRFAYRLEGFDSDWTETDASRRLAAYTNLPPGAYVLRIRANGAEKSGASLTIRVLPAWYQTWVARLAFIALGAGAIALLVRARTAHLRRRERELRITVDQRTADLLESNRKLELLSTTDRLTGAYNRLFLDTTLESEFARSRRNGRPFSVVIIDMDKFKAVNDGFGHLAGDRVLVHLVEVLGSHIRKTDSLGRWGGEEFLIICPDTPPAGAAELAESLRKAVEGTVFPEVGGKTISVGVATLRDGETTGDLVSRADAALYSAKNGGRNKVVTEV